jgi:hypothetical protein
VGRRVDQLRDPSESVEEAEFGMDVEMREVVRGQAHRHRIAAVGPSPLTISASFT